MSTKNISPFLYTQFPTLISCWANFSFNFLSFCIHQKGPIYFLENSVISEYRTYAMQLQNKINLKISVPLPSTKWNSKSRFFNLSMFFRMLSRASFQIRRAASSEFTLEKLTGADAGIAIMSINRPKAMNSFSRSMVNATKEAIMECKVNVID